MKKIKYLFSRLVSMDFKSMIDKAKTVKQRTGRSVLVTLVDMTYCGFKYLAGYMDYLVFEFYNLTREQRKTQVTRGINNSFVKALNQKDSWYKFDDKSEFNKIFKDYLKREWLDIECSSDGEFEEFVTRNKTVIVKPKNGTCGKGVEKLSLSDFENALKMKEYCLKNSQLIAEQVVYQHDKLNELFKNCVNTVRTVTINHNGRVSIVFCSIRIGAGDTIVDNLNSGGMAAIVDYKTGTITTDAADKLGNVFKVHPDSGTVINGFVIPMFDKAVEMVMSAAQKVPEIGYTGWDVAITNDGPLLIEGNHFPGHDIYQMPALTRDGFGVLPAFKKALED